MKAAKRDEKIAAAKARDAKLIAKMPEAYQPITLPGSTRESQQWFFRSMRRVKDQMDKQKREEELQTLREKFITRESSLIALSNDQEMNQKINGMIADLALAPVIRNR